MYVRTTSDFYQSFFFGFQSIEQFDALTVPRPNSSLSMSSAQFLMDGGEKGAHVQRILDQAYL